MSSKIYFYFYHLSATYSWRRKERLMVTMTEKEFEILSSRLRPKLDALVRYFARASGIETEDIVQETLVSLWQLYSDGYPVKEPEALAVKIAKTTCVAHYRRKRIAVQELGKDDFCGGEEATCLTDMEDCRLLRKKIFAALSETQKEYLRLRNEENLSLDQIASVTGKPKTSIKSTICSARRTMQEIFRKQL